MGFLPDIRRILAALPEDRQNMLFSATMPREIRHLADALLYEPHVVELNQDKPLETIEHALFSVENPSKFDLLERVLAEDGFVSAIVFTRTKHRARKLARQLDSAGHQAVALQGNMSQNQRDRALNGFRAEKFDILVATDIAARGLDIEQVTHVINFDMPTTPDAYTHRIGRTGRSERQGRAYTFVTPDDYDLVQAVERRMGAAIPRQAFDGLGGAAVEVAARPDQERSTQRAPRRPGGRGQGQGGGRRRRNGGGGGGNRGNGANSNGGARRNGSSNGNRAGGRSANRTPASKRA
jgi:superfamily II DNA/RNA helicase